MYKTNFAFVKQVQFAREHEFYKLLDYLAKSDGSTCLAWEHNDNQVAQGDECLIQIQIQISQISYD